MGNKLNPHPDPESTPTQPGGLVPPAGPVPVPGEQFVRPVEQAAKAKPAIDEENEEPTPDKNPEFQGEVPDRRDGSAPVQQPSSNVDLPVDLAAVISNEFGTPRNLVNVELGAGAKVFIDDERYEGNTAAIPAEQIQGKLVRVEGPNKTFKFEYVG